MAASSAAVHLKKPARVLTPELARRLAITRQRLAGPSPVAGVRGMLDLVRDLGCLQLDPISVVARSHLLVLQSRLGLYDPTHLDALLWERRQLFEYWAHCASIVLTEDYQLHMPLMRSYQLGESGWAAKGRAWRQANADLRSHILGEVERRGPLPSRAFEDNAKDGWRSTGWTSGRNVSRMLDNLWIGGELMVAGRSGGQKLWDLTDRCLPDWAPREELPEREVVRRAAQRSLRALGVARANHISQHFIRGRYPGLTHVLKELEAEGAIEQVSIDGADAPWPGPWYIHTEDLPLLERLQAGDWAPRTTLLSPFDNLICDRARTEKLFGFRFRIEIYTPKAQRQYGYYVLPILHGDRLIGRIDPVMDRTTGQLRINAIHAEPDMPQTDEIGKAVEDAIHRLATFLGARQVSYAGPVPECWKGGVMRA